MNPLYNHPAPLKPSATVILARQSNATIEVYLLRRNPASRAFPGFYVFPGGTLETDDMDTDFWRNHTDLANHQLNDRFDGEVKQWLPFAVAAVRETFEEAGLLLATTSKGKAVPALSRRSHGRFSRQIADHDLKLTVSKLGRWSRWITPASMSKRFDTFFFIVPVDPDQDCRPDNHETVHGMWIDPANALLKNSLGQCPLSPPTLVTLHQLLDYKDLGHLVTDAHRHSWPKPFKPRMIKVAGETLILEPWDPDYAEQQVTVDADYLENDMLSPHAPFSRLWLHKGCWRPVAHRHGIQIRP